MLRETSEMNNYMLQQGESGRQCGKYNWDRKLNDTDANDDGEDNATAHFTACVALHN